jgi:hypothetical protein
MARPVFNMIVVMSILTAGCAKDQEDETKVYNTTVILGTWHWDVDSNKQGSSDTADFWWEQVNDTERYLVPENGAEARLIPNGNYDTIEPDFIDNQTLSTDKISGTNERGVLVPGAVVVFRTAEGNLGKMQVERYRALHDFSFKEAEYLTQRWREFVLKKPNKELYHLQVRWKLFRIN